MALTAHQEEKLSEALAILRTSDRLVLKGSAGVGKTFMCDELIKALMSSGIVNRHGRVLCGAPTHKALGVLQTKVSANVDFSTAHSALKYRRITDKQTGEKSFRPQYSANYPPLQGYAVLVIDESSMIGVEMLGYIETHATNQRIKVIFVGDDKQINPPSEEESSVFLGKPTIVEDVNHPGVIQKFGEETFVMQAPKGMYYSFEKYPEVELTEIIRQGPGNPIITLSRNISAIWDLKTRLVTKEDGSRNGFVYTYDKDKVIEELAKVNGTDEMKYLAYTNVEVDAMNLSVRQKIYGPEPAKIEPDETIVFDAPYGAYHTNEELKVEKLDIADITYNVIVENSRMSDTKFQEITLKTYIINGEEVDQWGDGDKVWRGIFVIHEDSEKDLKNFISLLNANCKYKLLDYQTRDDFTDKFASFKYNHAITVHKSQGSTYKNTILNVKNINVNQSKKEKQRLFYTGITRTSELLILYNV